MDSIQVELLAERINAQALAHEKYAQAFIRILETLDSITSHLNRVESVEVSNARELLKSAAEIAEELRNYHEVSKDIKNTVQDKIEEYKDETDKYIEELYLQRHFVEEAYPALKALEFKLNESGDSLMQNIDITRLGVTDVVQKIKVVLDVCEKMEISMKDKIAALVDISNTLKIIQEEQHHWSKFWQRSAYFGGALITVAVLIQAFIQLGLMKIVWNP